MNAVFALLVLQQTGFATPITISEKDVTLPEICNEIGVKSGLKIDLDHEAWNDKVTVFVKDMKAKDLLDRLVSLYDLDGAAIDGRYRIKLEIKTKKAFEDYVKAEYVLRMNRVWSELKALAKLTLRPFGDKAIVVDKDADEATQWAQQHISQPQFYAAGLWERASEELRPGELNHLDIWATVLSDLQTNVFWVGFPENPPPPPKTGFFAKNFMDENSRLLVGTVVGISSLETTAELRVRLIPGKAENGDVLDRPFLFAHPPKELQKTAFALRLAAWQTPCVATNLGEEIKDAKPPDDPGYFSGKISLSEKLQNLHNRTGVPIVATSFRTPALEQTYRMAASPADLLDDLTDKEQAFVRWDNGCLLLRHPAYWIFQCSEPPESAMREAESIASTRPLSLFEYGGLARLIAPCVDDEPPWLHTPDVWAREDGPLGTSAIPRSFERLVKGRGFLSRFDPEPLENAYPVLAVLGSMDPVDLERFAEGEKLDAVRTWISGYKTGPPMIGAFSKVKVGGKMLAGTTSPSLPPTVTPEYRGTFSALPDFAADLAPFFPTTIADTFLTIPERRGELHLHAGDPDARARFLWLDWASGDDYRIAVGYRDQPNAIYSFTIRPNPPR